MAEKVKNSAVFFNPLSKDNPVIVQVLGICSAVFVTLVCIWSVMLKRSNQKQPVVRTRRK